MRFPRFAWVQWVLAGLTWLPQDAVGGSLGGGFSATVNVASTCSVVATQLSFGSFDTFGGALDQTATLYVTCNPGTHWTLQLNKGTYASSFATRVMSDGHGRQLFYNLYLDSSYTTVWDDDAAVKSGVGTGVAEPQTIYGRLPGGQTSAVQGSYSDSVTATLVY